MTLLSLLTMNVALLFVQTLWAFYRDAFFMKYQYDLKALRDSYENDRTTFFRNAKSMTQEIEFLQKECARLNERATMDAAARQYEMQSILKNGSSMNKAAFERI